MGKLYFKRTLFYLIHLFFSVGVPAILIIQIYGLFEQGQTAPSGEEFVRLRSIAMIVFIAVLMLGINALTKWYKSLPDVSAIKTYPSVMIKPLIFTAMYLLLLFSDKFIDRIMYITFYSAISNAIAIIPAIMHRNVVKEIIVAETQSGLRR
jgi:fumarate reductase subunit C